VGGHLLLVREGHAVDPLQGVVVGIAEEAGLLLVSIRRCEQSLTSQPRVKRRTYYDEEFFMIAKVSILLVSGTSSEG
jgi:hypothetical protein